MPCRCPERRTALRTAARSTLTGDTTALRSAATFIGRTSVEDVEAMLRRMAGRVTGPRRV